jgi:L,D-transpeptidase YcbB
MKNLFICVLLFVSSFTNAQFNNESLKKEFEKTGNSFHSKEHIKELYTNVQYQLLWLPHYEQQQSIYRLLDSSDYYGLTAGDYQKEFIDAFRQNKIVLKTLADSITADIKLTDAAVHFFCDLAFGNKAPSFAVNNLGYLPATKGLAIQFLKYFPATEWPRLIAELEPQSIEYRNTKMLLNRWQLLMADTTFREEKVVSTEVSIRNTQLVQRLLQLGTLDTSAKLADTVILKAVKNTQSLFDLYADGRLRTTVLAAINTSISKRIEELKLALNTIRYLNGMKAEHLSAFLNIPSANLSVYKEGQLELFSKIIVGKPSTPTPLQTGLIHEVIFYPYWNVPHSIATKELLPIIKKSRSYLEANNYQVLNSQGKVVDPSSINWSSLSASNFPYRLRQGTGCDNALGIVKFNFNNPFSVYLHDTPNRSLFNLGRRYLSHGCMRVEKFVELAALLLNGDEQLVKRYTDNCLKDQKPSAYPAESPLALAVLYSTAWYTEKGEVRFYENIYKR